MYGGRTIVVDATLRSPLIGSGMRRFNSHVEDGATFAQAVRDKHHKYPELAAQAQRLLFIVAATQVGDRCNDELIDLVRQLALQGLVLCAIAPPVNARGSGPSLLGYPLGCNPAGRSAMRVYSLRAARAGGFPPPGLGSDPRVL